MASSIADEVLNDGEEGDNQLIKLQPETYIEAFLIKGRLGTHYYSGILDTGSPYSLITDDYLRQIEMENTEVKFLHMKLPTRKMYPCAGRECIVSVGSISMELILLNENQVEHRYEHIVKVMKSFNVNFLLVLQFIYKFDLIPRLRTGKFSIATPDGKKRV